MRALLAASLAAQSWILAAPAAVGAPAAVESVSIGYGSARGPGSLARLTLTVSPKDFSTRVRGGDGDLEIRLGGGGKDLHFIDHLNGQEVRVPVSKLQEDLAKAFDPVERGRRKAQSLVPAQQRDLNVALDGNADAIRALEKAPELVRAHPRVRRVGFMEARARSWKLDNKPAAEEWLVRWDRARLPKEAFAAATELRPLWELVWRGTAGRDADPAAVAAVPPRFWKPFLDSALLLRDADGIPLEITYYGARRRVSVLTFRNWNRRGNAP